MTERNYKQFERERYLILCKLDKSNVCYLLEGIWMVQKHGQEFEIFRSLITTSVLSKQSTWKSQ